VSFKNASGSKTFLGIYIVIEYIYTVVLSYIQYSMQMKVKKNLSNLVVEFILTCPGGMLAELTIGQIIDEFGVSRAHLYKQFKMSKSFTIREFINRIRIFRSALLLTNNQELTVKMISEKMGFCNSEYFIRVFEKYFGITPGRYRQLFLNSGKVK
jgi:AraC-like DNA-binding protein